MVIFVRNHVLSCDTNAEGDVLYNAISGALRDSDRVTVDFSGLPNATSSFVNSAFVPLLVSFSFAAIKSRLQIVGAHPQIAAMIRDRMNFESHRVRQVA